MPTFICYPFSRKSLPTVSADFLGPQTLIVNKSDTVKAFVRLLKIYMTGPGDFSFNGVAALK